MKKYITKTLFLALAALLLHPGIHSASSSSSSSAASSSYGMPEEDLQPNSLYEIMFKGLAGNEFFDALEKVGQEQPGLTNQQKVDAAIQNMEHFGDIFNPRFYLRDLARDELFEQLKIVRRKQPNITDPQNIIEAAIKRMWFVPLFDGDLKKQALFSIVSNNKPLHDFLGLSIQDLIDHNLVPNIITNFHEKALSLSNMYIDDLTGIQNIPGINSVQNLFLDNNRLQTIAPGTFADLTDLLRLDLKNNQLQAIAPGTFADLTNLEYLHLDNNQLQTIAPETFAGLADLGILGLNNNQLQAIAPGSFAGLTNLEMILLSGNHITDPSEQNRITTELRAINPNVHIEFKNQTAPPSVLPDDANTSKRGRGEISGGSQPANNREKQARTAAHMLSSSSSSSSSASPSSSSSLVDDPQSEELPATTPFSWPNDDEPSSSLMDD